MIKTVKMSSVQTQQGVFILIFGLPGYGKTSSVRNFPKDKTAIICSEPQGLVSLQKFGWDELKVVCPTDPDDYLKALESVLGDDSIKHIVMDTISQYYDLLLKSYIEGVNKEVDKIDARHMYGSCSLNFQKMFRRLLDALTMGKDVVGLVHMKIKDDGDEVKTREPALPGQMPAFVCRQASLVLRAEKVRAGTETKYLLLADGDAGSYSKDLYDVAPTAKSNDLWELLKSIREKQPKVEPKVVTSNPNGLSDYAGLLRLGTQHKVAKTDLDKLLTKLNVKPTAATQADWDKVNAAFTEQYIAF